MSSASLNSKRQSIIMVASKLFLQQGFNAVSMDKIAQAAPVSKATLYKYFTSKHDLLAAVINELCTDLLHTLDSLSLEANDLRVNLNKIAVTFMDLIFAEEALAIYRLVIAECYQFPELGKLVYASGPKPVLTLLENYLCKINHQQNIHISDTAFAADAFFSLLKGDRHFQCLLGILLPPTAEQKQLIIHQVVNVTIQGLIYDH